MDASSVQEIGVRLVSAALLGGLIGLEREAHGRPAGLRTHTLVSLGAALVMILSAHAVSPSAPGDGRVGDPTRIAAQVVSGIGFLGAGTILRSGASVRGLTTAASLWVVAGIGLACGAALYSGALMATALAVVTLHGLSLIETRLMAKRRPAVLEVEAAADRAGLLEAVIARAEEQGMAIARMDAHGGKGSPWRLELSLEPTHRRRVARFADSLAHIEGVASVRFEV